MHNRQYTDGLSMINFMHKLMQTATANKSIAVMCPALAGKPCNSIHKAVSRQGSHLLYLKMIGR